MALMTFNVPAVPPQREHQPEINPSGVAHEFPIKPPSRRLATKPARLTWQQIQDAETTPHAE